MFLFYCICANRLPKWIASVLRTVPLRDVHRLKLNVKLKRAWLLESRRRVAGGLHLCKVSIIRCASRLSTLSDECKIEMV